MATADPLAHMAAITMQCAGFVAPQPMGFPYCAPLPMQPTNGAVPPGVAFAGFQAGQMGPPLFAPQWPMMQPMGVVVPMPMPLLMPMQPTPALGFSQGNSLCLPVVAGGSAARINEVPVPPSPSPTSRMQAGAGEAVPAHGNADVDSPRSEPPTDSAQLAPSPSGRELPTPTTSKFYDNFERELVYGDTQAMALRKNCVEAPHCTVSFVDVVGMTWQGADDVLALKRRMVDNMADMSVKIDFIEQKGPHEAEVTATWSGTQRDQLFPFFPCGKPARWQVRLRFSFDANLKAKDVAIRLDPIAKLIRQPTNLDALAQCALQLAATAQGSRLLQAGLESVPAHLQAWLLQQMRGHIWEVSASPHGNHVLQAFITSAPHPVVVFVADELRGQAVAAAKHLTRSRVLERLFEHCPPEVTGPLFEELLPCAAALAPHRYANFVVQRMIEHSGEAERHRVVLQLAPQAFELACSQHANAVVGAAFRHCSAEDKDLLMQELAAGPGGIPALLKHRHGSFVGRQLRLAGLVGVRAGDKRHAGPSS